MSVVRAAALALALAATLGGCRAKPQWQGRGDVLAVYRATTLTTEFPERVEVPAVVAAAESTLRRRGYSITARETTLDRGRVVGAPPNPGVLERVVVTASLSDLGTRVRIRMDPLGGETPARAILDDMLARLGY